MTRIGLSALALAMAAACSPAQQTTIEAPPTTETNVADATPACTADAPARAVQFAGQTYQVQAHAEGASCDAAVATLRITAPNGSNAFETSYPIAQVPLAFNATGSGAARLTAELEGWTQNVAERPNADSLPAWPVGAEKPPHFTPALSRDAYEAARSAQRPIFCFPDGNESNACVAIDTGAQTATLLGTWTPGRP